MKRVIFDMDGTLVNNDALTVRSAREALFEYFGARGETAVYPSPERVRSLVGLPAEEYFRGLLPEDHAGDAPAFMAIAQRHEVERLQAGEGKMFPGIPALLASLQSDGWRVGLVSNCLRGYLDANLDHTLRRDWFEIALCLDDEPTKTANVRRVLEGFGGVDGGGVMVGDRGSDLTAGAASGLRTVGCAYGFGEAEELAGADAVVDDPGALAEAIRGLAATG